MKGDQEIEILFRRLRLYDQIGRRAERLVRTIPLKLEDLLTLPSDLAAHVLDFGANVI